MARSRLAVALLVPPPFAERVDAVRAAVGDRSRERVAPHLTLVPPVNVNGERLGGAHDVLRQAGAVTRPFTLALGPPTTFLPDSPVLYLPVTGETGPAAVAGLRGRVFRPPLSREVDWPFVPHVTLADHLPEDRLHAAVAALADLTMEVTFDRVHLLVERRRDDGTVAWESLADARFAAPAVVGRGGLELELDLSGGPGPEAAAFAEREWSLFDLAELGRPADVQRPITVTARRAGTVVGVARGRVTGETAHLSELLVDAASRGEGIGSHLLAAFEAHARGEGCDRMTVHALAGSTAERFYRQRGWTEAHALPRWRDGRDFVRLQRHLNDPAVPLRGRDRR